MKKILEKNQKKNKGFTLLVAIVVTSILLVVSFAVINVAVKQLVLANSSEESQYAFYAANAGIECAQYWDLKDPDRSQFDIDSPGTISCNGQTIGVGNPETVPTLPGASAAVIGGGGSSDPTSIFGLFFEKGCAIVRVTKEAGGDTNIDSRGYNTCDTSATRRFERGIVMRYTNGSP